MAVEEDLTSIAAIEQYINKQVLTNVQTEEKGGKKRRLLNPRMSKKLKYEGIHNLTKSKR